MASAGRGGKLVKTVRSPSEVQMVKLNVPLKSTQNMLKGNNMTDNTDGTKQNFTFC